MIEAGLRAAFESCARQGEMGDNPPTWEEICAQTDADPELRVQRDEAQAECRIVIEAALAAQHTA